MQTQHLDLSRPKQSKAYSKAFEDLHAIQKRRSANASSWHQIGEFLQSDHLSSLGLSLKPSRSAVATEDGVAVTVGTTRSDPVGNTGITSTTVNGRSNG